MADSVYTVVELIGTSAESWEAAASAAPFAGVKVVARPSRRGDRRARHAARGG